ncbi:MULTISPECIES: GNAT family N-acetyltransferase [unclassified Tenacibaculum]|uniref:GNAT family N-acetyltransferase n=1 Tax=unclassified Tenacibaculum TaxID=2635139 RepID=UPI001F466D77|nr:MULTISPECIES: GNAT family N-acetyltransferase [unclassified Tenacibaculum]MCF2875466.1 GNAT family N-acetyltransferase [Tenacibaculum sp. Cn5-1]MCF2935542.1 GNAT family N-acetyltransferase [Tenacibaculum sp. Cn5-34]MCG7512102.1 GNAT family N-acetyltransferase [Tenacibaculum sp. Cn5-46]
MIEKANIKDAKLLTNIALISKAYWGYNEELINSWKDDLTVTPKMIEEMMVYKFISNQKTIGFYILNQPKNNSIELEFLFVHPDAIGQKIGKQLLSHAIEKSNNLNIETMTLLADPNAQPFYESQGFISTEKKESSIPNRFLPLMKINLK